MANIATTKLSSKGQVVIPEEIRDRLHLKIGDQFIVLAKKDTVILKTISSSIKNFDKLITIARHQAKEAKLTKKSLKSIIKESRKK